MTTIEVLSPEAGLDLELAARAQRTMADYENHFRMYLHTLPPCDNAAFWLELRHFQREMANAPHGSVEWAADEYLRRRGYEDHALPQAVHFVATYRHYVSKASKACFPVKGWGHADCSDDGFSDLCDAMPMVGPTIFNALCEGDYFSSGRVYMDTLRQHVRDACPGFDHLLLGGENYFAMRLEEAAAVKVRYYAIREERA